LNWSGVGGALNLPIARILLVGVGGRGEDFGVCACEAIGMSRRERANMRASVFI
jgi:hypothetical protein